MRVQVAALGLLFYGCGNRGENDTQNDSETGRGRDTSDTQEPTASTLNVVDIHLDDIVSGEIVPFAVKASNSGTGDMYDADNLQCSFNFNIPGWTPDYENACTGTFDSGFVSAPYSANGTVEVTAFDSLKGNGRISVSVVRDSSSIVINAGNLSGYTDETLTGTAQVLEGDVERATLTPVGELSDVVASTSVNVGGAIIDYSLTFKDINWPDYTSGTVGGTATLEVCNAEGCTSEAINVEGYVPSNLSVSVEDIPRDVGALSGATVKMKCDNGDDYLLVTDSAGIATVGLNSSNTNCNIETSKGGDYIVHSRTHTILDRVTNVNVQLMPYFIPAIKWDPIYGDSTCASGIMTDSIEFMLYAVNMIVPAGDSGRRTFIRAESGVFTTTLKYWVATIDSTGNIIDNEIYGALDDTMTKAVARFNDENGTGADVFEKATSINDAHVVVYYDNQWNSVSKGYDSSDILGTYGSNNYSRILLHDGTYDVSTALAELHNVVVGNDICTGVTVLDETFSKGDSFSLGVTLYAEEQDYMDHIEKP